MLVDSWVEKLLTMYPAYAAKVPAVVSLLREYAVARDNPEVVAVYAFALLQSGSYDFAETPEIVAGQAVQHALFVIEASQKIGFKNLNHV